ncbi:hypothetical protein HY988_04355 [Candidatus Micrarchaeota archaeon]|nr:hypothetical protein [Candidatus Micrarchaeota archaeon]
MRLHPGIRELRIRNFISSLWIDPAWKEKRAVYMHANTSLLSRFNLTEPDKYQKSESLLTDASAIQRSFLLPPTNNSAPLNLNRTVLYEFFAFLNSLGPHLDFFWKLHHANIVALGDLVHTIRFRPEHRFSTDDYTLSHILDVPFSSLTPEDYSAFRTALTYKQPLRTRIRKARYFPALLRSWNFCLSNISGEPSSILYGLASAARRQEEFYSLASFLGFNIKHTFGTVVDYDFLTNPNSQRSSSISRAQIVLEDGYKAFVTAVFDGTNYAKSSRALLLADQTFDIAINAGWIKTPEDVRKLMVLIDLVIAMEQITVSRRNPDFDATDMALSAVIALETAAQLHFSYCGRGTGFAIAADDGVLEKDYTLFHNRDTGLGIANPTINLESHWARRSSIVSLKTASGKWPCPLVSLRDEAAGDIEIEIDVVGFEGGDAL